MYFGGNGGLGHKTTKRTVRKGKEVGGGGHLVHRTHLPGKQKGKGKGQQEKRGRECTGDKVSAKNKRGVRSILC